MSINQVRVENSIPCLIEKECRVMERKDINAIFEIENEKYSEVGTLFLTSKRLIFCSEESKSLHSFEAEINSAQIALDHMEYVNAFLAMCAAPIDAARYRAMKRSKRSVLIGDNKGLFTAVRARIQSPQKVRNA